MGDSPFLIYRDASKKKSTVRIDFSNDKKLGTRFRSHGSAEQCCDARAVVGLIRQQNRSPGPQRYDYAWWVPAATRSWRAGGRPPPVALRAPADRRADGVRALVVPGVLSRRATVRPRT